MLSFLRKLETIEIQKGEILWGEMQDVQMVLFIAHGSIDLGYEINRITNFVMRLQGCL